MSGFGNVDKIRANRTNPGDVVRRQGKEVLIVFANARQVSVFCLFHKEHRFLPPNGFVTRVGRVTNIEYV
jgi:hypothetical protein